MNADRLLAQYEQIADAPDAIARLRRFILDLAVRGKLLQQDANDEPASELLKRIAKEKARLVKAGEIRTPKAVPALTETPFPIPSNWRWSQLAEIGVLSPRNEAPDTLEVSFVPMPLIAAEYGVANQHEVRSWGEIKKGYTHFAEGDVGLAKITPCFENGKSTVFRNLSGGVGSGTTELHIVRPLFVDPDYILLFLKSPHFIETGIPKMTGTAGQKRVPTEYFAHSPFPLPPLAEQHRIVAKVDELMGLCDRLETARAGREAARDRLAAASLARLSAPDPETFQADARFALDALPALTTRPDQIKRLRQTILNLAVRGKLVPQHANDEPASELLKRIANQKVRMIKAGEIRKAKAVPELSTADLPFEISKGWEWIRLEHLAHKITDGEHLSPNKTASGMPLLTAVHVSIKGLTLANPQFVSIEDGKKCRLRCDPRRGDILICSRGTIGRCAVVDVDDIFCLMGSVIQVRLPEECSPLYFNYFLSTDRAQTQVRGMSGATAVQALYLKDIQLCPIPLPPVAEQHRIVAKVDALMALCDRLEASLTATAATRRRLLDALLAEALAPADARQLEAAE